MDNGSTGGEQNKINNNKEENGAPPGHISTRSKELRKQIFEKSFTWRLTEEEIRQKAFVLRYSTTQDCYYRMSLSEGAILAIEGWQNGTYGSINIQRFRCKKENGQEWTYLTRQPGGSSASASWWLDFRGSGMVIDDVNAYTYGRTLRNGRISFDLLSPDLVPSDDAVKNQRKRKGSLNGWQSLLVTAYLEGNASDVETTQLFYHDMNDKQGFYPLDIVITLKPLEYLICTCNSSNKLPPIKRTSSERITHESCSSISGQNHRRTLSLRQPLPPVKIHNSWTNTPPRTISNSVVIEVHSSHQEDDDANLVAEVGSSGRPQRESELSKTSRKGSKRKTHPGETNSEPTDSRFMNTIAKFAIDDGPGSPLGVNNDAGILDTTEEGGGKTHPQSTDALQTIIRENNEQRPSSGCIVL